MSGRFEKNEQGFILVTALVWVVVCGILATGLLFMARTSVNATVPKAKSETSYLLAQSALQKAKRDVYRKFKEYVASEPNPGSVTKLDWFESFVEGQSYGPSGYVYSFPKEVSLPRPLGEVRSSGGIGARSGDLCDGTYSVTIEAKKFDRVTPLAGGEVGLATKAYMAKIRVDSNLEGFKRSVEEVALYGFYHLDFTFAMFTERAPDIGAARVDIEGDIFINDFWDPSEYPKRVNGDLYTVSDIPSDPMFWTLDQYIKSASDGAAPVDTVDNPQEYGYDGNPETFDNKDPIPVPRISDFQKYMEFGEKMSGSSLKASTATLDPANLSNVHFKGKSDISLNGIVYQGLGPDGLYNTPDDGSLVLDGSKLPDGTPNPIEINGPIVVEGDLVIKGEITGVGTFFVGGNIHIVGDLTYVNPLKNPKEGATEEEIEKMNEGSDLIGFASAKNIILGDTTSSIGFRKTLNAINDAKIDSADFDPKIDPYLGTVDYPFEGDYTDVAGQMTSVGFDNKSLSGTIKGATGSQLLLGDGTKFSSELGVGSEVKITKAGVTETYVVTEVVSDSEVKIDKAVVKDFVSGTGGVNAGVKSAATEDRTFYESVVGDTLLKEMSSFRGGDGSVDMIDGVMITNHLFAGTMGTDAVLTGSIVARDIALDFDGNNHITWDNRLPNKFNDLFSLNGELALAPAVLFSPKRVVWRELPIRE